MKTAPQYSVRITIKHLDGKSAGLVKTLVFDASTEAEAHEVVTNFTREPIFKGFPKTLEVVAHEVRMIK